MIKKILVPLDGSKLAEKALPYAESFAQKYEAELILVWVLQHPIMVPMDYGGAVIPIDTMMAQAENEASDYLRNLQAKFRQQKIPTRVTILKSHAVAEAIIDLAHKEKADMIIKTTHGRTGPSRWIFGNVAAKVLQRAPCPVFLVRISDADLAK
ncbi:MAG TPA: universal stress protein [Gammaproteobacteria bacterium]|nr:universal stress protein [Gammaproteobacteria bacterium]